MKRRRFLSSIGVGVAGGLILTGFSCKKNNQPVISDPLPDTDGIIMGKCLYNYEMLYCAQTPNMTKARIQKEILDLSGTDIDTLMCCPSAWRFYMYPSKIDLTWKESTKFARDTSLFPNWDTLIAYMKNGGDPLADIIEATRTINKKFMLSVRMNDWHNLDKIEHPCHNNFWREHFDYHLGTFPGAPTIREDSRLFNFMIPEVREFYYQMIEEMCTKYAVDGVELDFQRTYRYFKDKDVVAGTPFMTELVKRIREMLDKVGKSRGKYLNLCIRSLDTIARSKSIGVDIMDWEAKGWLDMINVSPMYTHSVDMGIEEFVANRKKAKIYGEMNYIVTYNVNSSPENCRHTTIEMYYAAVLNYLGRGADGVSFFNIDYIPPPYHTEMKTKFRGIMNIEAIKKKDKDYPVYPSTLTVNIFPAKDVKVFDIFIGDDVANGLFEKSALRIETKDICTNLNIEASINDSKLIAFTSGFANFFLPVMINNAVPQFDHLKFFTVPLNVLKKGHNKIEIKNLDSGKQSCDFMSAELALFMKR